MNALRRHKEALLLVASTTLLVMGGAAWLFDQHQIAAAVWYGGTALGLAACLSWLVGAVRRHELSVDVIAVLALAGALIVEEPFAGAMITVMLATGQQLEARA